MQTRNYYNSLAHIVDRYIPQHIKDNYPLYYDFIETYYEYLSQKDEYVAYNMKKNLQNWTDADTTLDDFVEYFKNEYINLPFDDDWGLYMKHYKEIYQTKGSTKSLQFFLKLLTGLDVNVTYPNRYLMKSSDGIYRKYKIIYCERNNDINYSDYISTVVVGGLSGAKGVVEKVDVYNDYVKVYLSSTELEFIDEPVRFDNGVQFLSNTIKTITGVKIINGGNNYSLEDKVVTNVPDLKLSLKTISSGIVDKIDIVNGGSNYEVGDLLTFSCEALDEYYAFPYVKVTKVDENGSIKHINIHYTGYGFLSIPTITGTDSVNGSGATFNLSSYNSGSITGFNIVYPVCGDDLDSGIITIESETGSGAELKIMTGYETFEDPYYYKGGSFLSDLYKLQDSFYYQEYSYVLDATGSVLEKYKEIFNSILHPSGFIYFTNAIIDNYIELTKRYVDSLIEFDVSDDLTRGQIQIIPLLHYDDRQITTEILRPYRKDRLNKYPDKKLEEFNNIGGKYISSELEIINE